jgi:hypothetical protein
MKKIKNVHLNLKQITLQRQQKILQDKNLIVKAN